MTEYEYSFETKELKPFIDYAIKRGYKLTKESRQERIIYRNPNKTMARLTINEMNGQTVKQLDFKEDKLTGEVLEKRKESLSLEYADDKAIESILEFLDYKKDNTLIRKRYVYETEGVKFELDEYTQPRVTAVVGIEGDKELVDKVYSEVKDLK